MNRSANCGVIDFIVIPGPTPAIGPSPSGLGPIADAYRRFLRAAAAGTSEPLTPRQAAAWEFIARFFECSLVSGRPEFRDFRVQAARDRYRAAAGAPTRADVARLAFAAAAKALGSAWTQLGRKLEAACERPSAEREEAARRWKRTVRERGVAMRAAANACVRLGLRFP